MSAVGFVKHVYFIDKSNPYAINGQFLIKWFIVDAKKSILKTDGETTPYPAETTTERRRDTMKKSTLVVLEKGNDSAIFGPMSVCCALNFVPFM
jgi:hypothetical protein